jgi:hypothetical protein
MNARQWLSSPARLVASHALTILLAVGAGWVYWGTTRDATQSFIDTIALAPRFDAANLAFRFGSADHARGLLNTLPMNPGGDPIAWGDRMMTEVRLAVLDQEHSKHATSTPHLSAARDACSRSGRVSCREDEVLELARRIANQRK